MGSCYFHGVLLIIFCLFAVSCNETEKVEIKHTKIMDSRYLSKIDFDGHTYIFLRNTWTAAGDRLLHDPGCECLKVDKI